MQNFSFFILLLFLANALAFHHNFESSKLCSQRRHMVDGYADKIASLKLDVENLENEYKNRPGESILSELNDKKQVVKIIIKCVEALHDIENDLLLFEKHENGNDKDLKETSKTFRDEFIQCRDAIKEKLQKLLP